MFKTLENSQEYTHWKDASQELKVGYMWFYRRIKDGRLEHKYDHRGQLYISNQSLFDELSDYQ
ncbi:hypothetical protein Pla110_24410 [Polystyrenella longa]|uniref:Helix-turn-helix domain protein n=1 Tax=Polystyrenella longa TaxID=2528007 RepID=A0A518CNB6_9PLAN|nr:hypothetical protein [Polystyrenella longa]QDU80709.1 hypothetical protein Pla110_24410 [Polystyrenella longa]